ncbi:phage antirepressor N-terminal domain-containing protein [Comamonas sp. J-3]
MSDSTQVAPLRAITVPFHGADLYVVEHNGQPYTPMKAIVEGMGLDWRSQAAKFRGNKERWGVVMITTPTSGDEQVSTCLPLRKLPGWLMTLHPSRLAPGNRARVIQYQNECDEVLWQYWNDGVAVNPRALYSVNPGDKLTKEEADTLRQLVESTAKKLAGDSKMQGKFILQAWSKLKSHFKVGYREIPRQELTEAISIVNRHTVEWEVVDDEPPQRALPQLPRLDLYMQPPAVGQYQFNRSNPYPRNGRTIEVAKSIAADIRNWSDNLPAGPARTDLHDAAQMLYDLLVSGWTDVDEALGQLHSAMHFLNRWQGRGGGIGNVA